MNTRVAVAAAGRWSGRRWMGLITRNWERKRFYRHVGVYKSGEFFGVKLDHRNLRTPLRQLFLVPFEPLALLVAQEWLGQVGVVKPSLMHITTLCNTVLDSPRTESREELAHSLISYLLSDTLRSRVGEPEKLVAMQKEEWDPLISWFNKRFEVNIETYETLLPPTIPPSMLKSVAEFMNKLNRWSFAGFELCVEACKSLIVSCALFEGQLTPEQAARLSRLEVRFQTERWGEVDWQHAVEESDLRARLSAGLIMHQLSNLCKIQLAF